MLLLDLKDITELRIVKSSVSSSSHSIALPLLMWSGYLAAAAGEFPNPRMV